MDSSKFFMTPEDGFNYEKERSDLVNNLNMLKAMSVEEQTFYKKWEECREFESKLDSSIVTKSKIWKPTDIHDKDKTLSEIRALRPSLKVAEKEHELEDWLNLRIFGHTMSYEQTPGRMVRILVYDEVTELYLGAVSLSSDVTDISVRDAYIGWNDENKFKQGKLRNTTIASCIMATQPLGYNFLGGKLVASLLSTQYVRDLWQRMYGDVLVGLTTTSLYGVNCMYNGIPYWKTLGESAGKIYIKPDEKYYKSWHHWLQQNKTIDYNKATEQKEGVSGPVTGIKQKIINMIMRQCNIKSSSYVHGNQRGVFFMPLYENTKEFLTGKIETNALIIKERIKKDRDGVMAWWLPKAERRYIKLLEENHVKPEVLYYNKLAFISWEEAKTQYFNEVGR